MLSWPQPFGSHGSEPHWFSKPHVLGTCLLGTGLKIWSVWYGVWTVHSLGRSSGFINSLLVVGRCAEGVVYGEIVSQPILPSSMWPSSCWPMYRSCSASFQLFFRENCSTCSCRFQCVHGEVEFRIFPQNRARKISNQQMMKMGHKDSEANEMGQTGTICASKEIMIMKNPWNKIGNCESIQI